ncbi:MAG: 5'-methylthioadenosine/S-adenosylhomocysteine nucleosidase [Candidatus Wallbacteria bacterium]|nr:5'-methylthioadenosine/S-adenosylhomocysteine nucleosidase [Candidatus Wallbacteria bacterium]
MQTPVNAVIVSADTEWKMLRSLLPDFPLKESPFGAWFVMDLNVTAREPGGEVRIVPVIFFQGGWGKISAAASTQYLIDRWKPDFLIVLGTCGGFEGEVERGTLIVAERTIVYDIVERMGNQEQAITHYTTEIDLSGLGIDLPDGALSTLLVSADRDLDPAEVGSLKERFRAVAGDWESGAIAWVAQRNSVKCLIAKAVSDLVGDSGGEAYGNLQTYADNTRKLMRKLLAILPGLIRIS